MKELVNRVPAPILIGIAAALLLLIVLTIVFTNLLYICRPNEVLIFSGRTQRTRDGKSQGFRVVFGGRGFRVPYVESVVRMDVSLISVPMSVTGAYSEGGIPLTVNAVANVKVSTDDRLIGNAIERFLGVGREQIARVAKETLEGHLRGVLATMTPEDVNQDRLKFAEHLASSAGGDLEKLGLHLDTLKIQHVADDRNYLQSIGRQRIAEILRGAEISESDAVRAAQEAEAQAQARAQVAQLNAEGAVAKKQNELRQIAAELDGQANAENEKASAAAQQARAEAELELQTIRGELEQLRLQAEVTIPAEVERQVRELFAAGQAAPIAADGEAMSKALAEVTAAWRESGGKAMDMFVLQHLDGIFAEVANAAKRVKIGEVNLIDSGDGATVASYASAYPQVVSALLAQVASTLGVDIAAVISGSPSSRSEVQS
ncbi:MAG TPA: flotillin family protein [Kofleriaceae bacterium]|nr:flotillin family protein [Kofleriaceae bacterium]